MSEFTFDAEKHIVIDGKAYEKEALPQEVVQAIQLINNTDQQLNQMQHDLNVYKVGRDGLVRQLIEKLEGVEYVAEVAQPEEGE